MCKKLEDLEFADDIALVRQKIAHARKKFEIALGKLLKWDWKWTRQRPQKWRLVPVTTEEMSRVKTKHKNE